MSKSVRQRELSCAPPGYASLRSLRHMCHMRNVYRYEHHSPAGGRVDLLQAYLFYKG